MIFTLFFDEKIVDDNKISYFFIYFHNLYHRRDIYISIHFVFYKEAEVKFVILMQKAIFNIL